MGVVIVSICAVVVVVIWFVSGLLNTSKERREDLERRTEIETGIVKSNAKADNSRRGSSIDDRVREKYNRR